MPPARPPLATTSPCGSASTSPTAPILVLASASPRRAAIFQALGMRFVAVPSGVDEAALAQGPAPERAVRLAAAKALAVAEGCELSGAPPWVVGADTLVFTEDRILGQPADRDEAAGMIRTLAGREHRVVTGVAVFDGAQCVSSFSDVTSVRFRAVEADELERYLDGEDWRGKAGAYAIQGQARSFVAALAGDAWNVVGFPVHLFLDRARVLGIPVPDARRSRSALAGLWVSADGSTGAEGWGPRWTAARPTPVPGPGRRR